MILLVLILLIVGVPLLELYVIIQVAHVVGAWQTIALLLAESIVGAWLLKRQGLGVLRRISEQLRNNQLPHRELVDGFLILLAGALMLAPGFVTDALGFLLVAAAGPRRSCEDWCSATSSAASARGWAGSACSVGPLAPVPARASGWSRRWSTPTPPRRPVRSLGPGPLRDRRRAAGRRHGHAAARRSGGPGGVHAPPQPQLRLRRRRLRLPRRGGRPRGPLDDLEAVCDGRTDAEARAGSASTRGAGLLGGGHPRELRGGRRAAGLRRQRAEASAARRPGHHRAVRRPPQRGRRTAPTPGGVCADEGLRLAVDGIHYFGHWITPEGAPRRYDTRFFVAAAPPRPDAAARRPRGDRQHLDPPSRRARPAPAPAPSRCSAHHLQPPGHRPLRTAADALDAAREIVDVPGDPAAVIASDGGVRIVLPGDPEYGEATRARSHSPNGRSVDRPAGERSDARNA